MEYLLTTNSITKRFGHHTAVNNVSLHIKQGDIYGLIGRNGAGKTTLMRMIGGLASATSGDFTLFNKTGREVLPLMTRIGLLIEQPGLYTGMSAADNMKLQCLARGVKSKKCIDELLTLVGLSDVGKKRVQNFSLGMKQRLGIAMAMVGDPDLLLLDEPINGLDPQGIVEIREIITKLNREKNITVVISSHILEELSKMATMYGIIHNGELLEEISRDELSAKCCERIEIVVNNTAAACSVIETMGIMNYKVVDKNTIEIYERLDESGAITLELAKNDVKTESVGVRRESLEEYYLNMTGGSRNV